MVGHQIYNSIVYVYDKDLNNLDYFEPDPKISRRIYAIDIDQNENILSEPVGYCSDDEFFNFLKKGIK